MHGRASKQDIFRSCDTSTFNATRLDERPFTCRCEKSHKKAEGFQISHFHWPFSSDIKVVKGLMRYGLVGDENPICQCKTMNPFLIRRVTAGHKIEREIGHRIDLVSSVLMN